MTVGVLGGEEEGTACKDAIVFLFFFRPPDRGKNPDWSDFMNYPTRRSDWSARAWVFSDSFIQHFNSCYYTLNSLTLF